MICKSNVGFNTYLSKYILLSEFIGRKNMNKILIIIPAYNESKNIVDVCNSIKNYDKDLDYIVINDGSTDDTLKVCKENKLNYINLISNLGIGGAVQTGYKYAYEKDYDIAIQFDGDGQHDINYIKEICRKIQKNEVDFCIGSRFIDSTSSFKSTFLRRVGIKIIASILKIFCNVKVTDPTSGFRAGNKKVIELFSKCYPTDYPEPESIVFLVNHGIIISEVPVNMNERQSGKSSIYAWKSIYYMIRVSLAIVIDSITLSKSRGDK